VLAEPPGGATEVLDDPEKFAIPEMVRSPLMIFQKLQNLLARHQE